MLVETIVQCVGPMLLELAIRQVAVPAAKRLARTRAAHGTAAASAADSTGLTATACLLRPVQAVEVVSAISGRLRVQVAGLNGQADLAKRLEQEVGGLAGVLEAKANARTGRMLVTFEPGLQSIGALTTSIDRTRAAHMAPSAGRTRHLAAVV